MFHSLDTRLQSGGERKFSDCYARVKEWISEHGISSTLPSASPELPPLFTSPLSTQQQETTERQLKSRTPTKSFPREATAKKKKNFAKKNLV
jgi:hypothetical protein